ncbi:hypothetical protein [Streptomyces sp. NPDC048224]
MTDWVTVKTRWRLTIDPTEAAGLSENLGRCPNGEITVTLTR